MPNLPITSNSLPPAAGNTQNAALGNGAADDTQATGAAPFAALLAQQIGGAEAALLNLAQISLGAQAGSGDPVSDTKETRDPSVVATDATVPADASNSAVMAMLMQLPQEPRNVPVADGAAKDAAAAAIGKSDAAKIGSALALPDTRNKLPQEASTTALGKPETTTKPDMAATLPTGQQPAVTETQTRDFAKQVELATGQSATPSPAAIAQMHAPAVHAALPSSVAKTNPAGENMQAINTPVGSHGWADEFSQKISWISTQQNQIAELHLNPPDLGPLNVVLKVTDNQATALFTSPHGAVREAVESSLPKLREVLADNGIMLGNATVSDQPPRERDMESFKGQGGGTSNQRDGGEAETGRLAAVSARQEVVRRHNGMVDTFA